MSTYSLETADACDREDPLAGYRGRFHIPRSADGSPVVYLAGNSLGLQLRAVDRAMAHRLDEWKALAVEAWHDRDWMEIDAQLAESQSRIVGGRPHEVTVAGTLTANLHVLMASFYRPQGTRTKILMEADAFPSDQYAAASQAAWHGLGPAEHLLEAEGDDQEAALLHAIEKHGDHIALLLLAGINYYTGRLFDMERITRAARDAGCVVGLDLAHAAGNVELRLHDWGVDFAAWCGYKYLNGGPGAPAALFVHQRHHQADLPRLSGWWGHSPETRFEMPAQFNAAHGAAGWQISTPSVLALAPLEASMAVFDEVGMPALLEKSRRLTAFLDGLLRERLSGRVEIVTPEARGAQLSLRVDGGREVFDALTDRGVVCDWREPDVVRVAPTPLYNCYRELVLFVDRLEEAVDQSSRM